MHDRIRVAIEGDDVVLWLHPRVRQTVHDPVSRLEVLLTRPRSEWRGHYRMRQRRAKRVLADVLPRGYREPRHAEEFGAGGVPVIRARIAAAAGRVVADLRQESVRLDRAGVEQWLCALAQAKSVLVARGHRLDQWSVEVTSGANDAIMLNAVQHFLIQAIDPRTSELAHEAFPPP